MGPQTFCELHEIILKYGYGRGDDAAMEISRKYRKALYVNYIIKVHYDWS